MLTPYHHNCKWLHQQLFTNVNGCRSNYVPRGTRRRGQAGAASRPRAGGGGGRHHRSPKTPQAAPAARARRSRGGGLPPRAGEGEGGSPTEPRKPHGKKPLQHGRGRLAAPAGAATARAGAACRPRLPLHLFNYCLVPISFSVIAYMNKVLLLIVYKLVKVKFF